MPLAEPGDPFVTTSGKVLVPKKGGELDALPHIIGAPLAKNHIASKRRSIQDMPTDARTQTAVIVVLVYSLLGLSENEIAHACNIDIAQVQQVKNHPAYQETFEDLFHELLSANSNSLQAKIAKMAPGALEQIAHISVNAKNDHARLKANQDILDRAGLHPEVLFGKHSNDAIEGLVINIRDAGGEANKEVNIDISRRK